MPPAARFLPVGRYQHSATVGPAVPELPFVFHAAGIRKDSPAVGPVVPEVARVGGAVGPGGGTAPLALALSHSPSYFSPPALT